MITVLPDFFIDVIVKGFNIEHKEGNIWTRNLIKYGGNATNFSIALGKLGIKHNLVVATGKIGEIILKYFINKYSLPINLYIIKTDDSITVSLEKENMKIMLTDPKGIQISSNKIKVCEDVLKSSEYIILGNWNNNRKSNDLLEYLLKETNAKIYLDTGDPTIAEDRINELIKIINKYGLWVLSLNEFELEFLAKRLNIEGSIIEKAKKLFEKLNIEHLDLHTIDFTYTLPDDILVKVDKVKPKIVTGAGDTWNAANFYGYLKDFKSERRLKFANEIARRYVLGLF